MEIQKIEKTYGRSPQADALFDLMGKKSVHSIFLQGLLCSSAPMFFASLQGKMRRSVLFVLTQAILEKRVRELEKKMEQMEHETEK
jgi:transcription-repair coupling factor (superfamily II helicase)